MSENPLIPTGRGIEEWSQKTEDTSATQYSHTGKITDCIKMDTEMHRKPDPEDPGTTDNVSLSCASPSQPGSRSMPEISGEGFKDEDPEWSTSAGLEGSSCGRPSEEKNPSEEVDREYEAMHAHGHMHQLHLSQHTGAWDSIARVNEEILLTMLEIYEKYKSKTMH